MELSTEQLPAVAGDPARGTQLKGEKRNSVRAPFGRRSAVLRDNGLATVVIRELSATGASLTASLALRVGERLVLCIPTLKGADLQVKCSVLRCERGAGGRVFVVGLKFESALPSQWSASSTPSGIAGETPDITRIRHAMLEE